MFSHRKFNGESKSGLKNTNFLLEQTFMGILKIFLYKSLRTSIIAHSHLNMVRFYDFRENEKFQNKYNIRIGTRASKDRCSLVAL